MSYDKKLLVGSLRQIEEAIDRILLWNESIGCSDDYGLSDNGMKTLTATCMLIQTIGENVKKIDARTEGKLLSEYPEVEWKNIKGMRDHIAHGYFDIDADLVFDVVTNHLLPLKKVMTKIICDLEK